MTTENNKLIDTFNENKYYKLFFSYDEMLYHSDWNWLMEVVEKIESLNYEFIIETFEVRIEQYNKILFNQHTKVANQRKKESVYNACVTFIKWYNQNSAKRIETEIYTYDIKENNVAVIRLINENDKEENYFDNLEVLKQQLISEKFNITFNL